MKENESMRNNNILSKAAKLLEQAANVGNDSEKESELLTIKDACAIAKVSRWTIKRWLDLKDKNENYIIRWFKIGKAKNGMVRIDRVSFMAFLESMAVTSDPTETVSA